MNDQLWVFAKYLAILGLISCLCLRYPLEICYGRASTSLGSTHGVEKEMELVLDNSVCQFIKTLAVLRSYEEAYNWHGEDTTTYNIYDSAYGCGESYAIAFYIGHGWNESVNDYQQWYITNDDGGKVYDKYIRLVTSPQRLKFAFIWSCFQASTRGGKYESGPQYGMPNAWLHTADLSEDGYADPDENDLCFIGFYREAPDLLYDMWGAENASYYFLLHFYSSALYQQETINDSLDTASFQVWYNTSFAYSKFYLGASFEDPDPPYEEGWVQMKVYGDGSHVIS